MMDVQQQDYEEVERQEYQEVEQKDFQDVVFSFVSVLWRRKTWVVIPLILGVGCAALLLTYLPKIYRSSTLILVEAQLVPQDYVKSAVSGSIAGRLSTIKQQILSRTNIQNLIEKYDLAATVSSLTNEGTVDLVRKDIQIETVGGKKDRIAAFTISFQGKKPELVMNVTSELASLFIEENLKIREQLVEGTTVFLENELSTLKGVLEHQEKLIGDYKRRYMGQLPGQLDANLRALDRYQTELLSIRYGQRAATDRIELLETTLEQVAEMNGGASSVGLLDLPRRSVSPLEQQLQNARAKLTEMNLQYNEDYPDLQILKLEVQNLEEQFAGGSSGSTQDQGLGRSAGMSGRQEAAKVSIKNQVQTAKVELSRLAEQEKKLRDQIQLYEQRVANVPEREQELAILVRDYNNTQSSYQVLLDKKLNAKISENLEKRQKGERFRVVDPANLPEKPISPNRLKIGLLGLFAGLGGGIGLALIRDQFNKSIGSPEEVEKLSPFPLLANIPDFTDEMKDEPS